MIENILQSKFLAVVLILSNPGVSCYYLDKYVHKTNWSEVFKNIDKHTDKISFMRTNFKKKDLKDEYLVSASANGHLEVVRILLEKGANVNAFGDEAINLANKNGHSKVVKLLLQKGANANAVSDYDLKITRKYKHTKVVKMFIKRPKNRWSR